MFPTLLPGDHLVIDAHTEVRIDDIVVFDRPNMPPAVHRVIEISGDELHTRGDTSPITDGWIHRHEVTGTVVSVRRFGLRMPLIPWRLVRWLGYITRPLLWRYYWLVASVKRFLARVHR